MNLTPDTIITIWNTYYQLAGDPEPLKYDDIKTLVIRSIWAVKRDAFINDLHERNAEFFGVKVEPLAHQLIMQRFVDLPTPATVETLAQGKLI